MARKIDGRIGDKYQLSAVLGQGAMGTVYAAKNLRTQKRVAIKSLHLRPGLDPGSPDLLRFEQEARIAGSLESPHIAQVLDIEHDPATDLPFLVMELLRGEDLQTLLDRVGPLQVDVALRVTAQACAGLEAAHKAGVVHRDIKPANIFLSKQEKGRIVVKILDFGIAKIRRLPEASSASTQGLLAPAVSMTETGQMLGSPLFMSPEQVDGAKQIDGRSDLFSLAVTLFAMLAGKPPYADVKSFHVLLRQLVTAPPPSIRTVVDWVPPHVDAFVQKASSLNREERFSSAEEMRSALEGLLPEGTDLREDMLVGVGDTRQASGSVQGSAVPYAQTEKVVAEPDSLTTAMTVPQTATSAMTEPDPATLAATLPHAVPTAATPPTGAPLAATLRSAGPMKKMAPRAQSAATPLESTGNRHARTIAVVVVAIVLVALLVVFAR